MRVVGTALRGLIAPAVAAAALIAGGVAQAADHGPAGGVEDPADAPSTGGVPGPDLRHLVVWLDPTEGWMMVNVFLDRAYNETSGVFDTFRLAFGDTFTADGPSCAANDPAVSLRLTGSIDPAATAAPVAVLGSGETVTGSRGLGGASGSIVGFSFRSPLLVGRTYRCGDGPELVRADAGAACDPVDPACAAPTPAADVGDRADAFAFDATWIADGVGIPAATDPTPTTALHRLAVTHHRCTIRASYATGPAAVTRYNKVLVKVRQRSGGRFRADRRLAVRPTAAGPRSATRFTRLRPGRYAVSAVYLGDRLRTRPPVVRRSVRIPAACGLRARGR